VNDNLQFEADKKLLEQFGYKQELSRTLKLFANFGVAFTYLSPVVGFYSLYAFGFQTGGPAFFWSIPIVVIGQLLVTLVFSELAGTFPLAGALYQWGRRLLGTRYGWFVGWIYGWALLVTITAVDYGGSPYVATAVGISNPSQGMLIGITLVMIIIQTIANFMGVQKLKLLINLGIFVEAVGTVGISLVLLFFGHQPASIITTTQGVQGQGSYLPVFIVAMLFSAFIFYGFESAADVAEEVLDPQRRVPKAMITALVVGGLTTMLSVFAFEYATPDIALALDPSKMPNPLDYILTSNLGAAASRIFLIMVSVAFLSCGAAVQAAATRVFYSYGRDKSIFGHKFLSYIHPRFQTPTNALWLSAVIAVVLSLSAKVESILTSFAVVGIYLAFQLVVLAAMIARVKGFRPTGSFQLGSWFWPVAILAFLYGVCMIVNLSRPMNPTAPWYVNYEVILMTAAIVVLGIIVYAVQRLRSPSAGVLDSSSGIEAR
jgi:amino acid transporter